MNTSIFSAAAVALFTVATVHAADNRPVLKSDTRSSCSAVISGTVSFARFNTILAKAVSAAAGARVNICFQNATHVVNETPEEDDTITITADNVTFSAAPNARAYIVKGDPGESDPDVGPLIKLDGAQNFAMENVKLIIDGTRAIGIDAQNASISRIRGVRFLNSAELGASLRLQESTLGTLENSEFVCQKDGNYGTQGPSAGILINAGSHLSSGTQLSFPGRCMVNIGLNSGTAGTLSEIHMPGGDVGILGTMSAIGSLNGLSSSTERWPVHLLLSEIGSIEEFHHTGTFGFRSWDSSVQVLRNFSISVTNQFAIQIGGTPNPQIGTLADGVLMAPAGNWISDQSLVGEISNVTFLLP